MTCQNSLLHLQMPIDVKPKSISHFLRLVFLWEPDSVSPEIYVSLSIDSSGCQVKPFFRLRWQALSLNWLQVSYTYDDGTLIHPGTTKSYINNDGEVILNRFRWNPCVTPHLLFCFWRGLDKTRIEVTWSYLFESCVGSLRGGRRLKWHVLFA